MSDAQAAPVTENGVPPVAQEKVEEAPGHKLFVGNLAYATTDEGLKALFAPFASDILSAHVIQRPIPRGGNTIRSAGYGFVALATAEAAQKAIESLDKKEIDGREIMVQLAKPSDQKEKDKKAKRRPGRRGSKAVPGEVSEAEANGEASKAEDTPVPASGEAAKPKKKKKKSKMARKAKKAAAGADAAGEGTSTAAAPATEGETSAAETSKKPRQRKPKAPRPPRPAGEDPAGEQSTTMLFVANLGFSIDEAALSTLFTEAGINVVSARIVCRRWGHPRKSKGYGFVDVGSPEEQQKAIAALEGKEVAGRPIAVKVAVNTPHEDTDEAAPTTDGADAPAPVAA